MSNNSLPTESSTKVSSTSTTSTTCRLLALPGELRNRIYRLALIKHDGDSRITYTSAGFQAPGLLTTCKRIRSEALKIFYYENTWHTHISRYDSSAAQRFNEIWADLGLDTDERQNGCTVHFSEPNWTNLLKWLRVFHSHDPFTKCPYPTAVHEVYAPRPAFWGGVMHQQRLIIGGMFATVKALRGQTWSLVEDSIAEQRQVLAGMDYRWLET